MAQVEPQNNRDDAHKADLSEALTAETLVRKYASAVLGLCLAHTNSVHDAEDMMQKTYLKAFTKFHTLRDRRRVRAWLLQIARRTCIDRQRRRPPLRLTHENIAARSEHTSEQIRRLHSAIAKLPESYREPISLYYLNGHNCPSVAQCLGISETAVRSRLARARLRLHEILSEDSL